MTAGETGTPSQPTHEELSPPHLPHGSNRAPLRLVFAGVSKWVREDERDGIRKKERRCEIVYYAYWQVECA